VLPLIAWGRSNWGTAEIPRSRPIQRPDKATRSERQGFSKAQPENDRQIVPELLFPRGQAKLKAATEEKPASGCAHRRERVRGHRPLEGHGSNPNRGLCHGT